MYEDVWLQCSIIHTKTAASLMSPEGPGEVYRKCIDGYLQVINLVYVA